MTRLVLVTGATGFVGKVLCERLAHAGYTVRAALRSDRAVPACIAEKVVVGEIGATTNWSAALEGVEYIVHAAARVHVMHDTASDLSAETNSSGTRCLANAAAAAGVRRLLFLSSVKVNGEETHGPAYTAGDEPNPRDPYGRSKWLAEQYLGQISASSTLEAVIVRPPLVYGPGVKANFLRLMRWVDKELPLPLGAVNNSRSLVSVWNLVDLLTDLLVNPAAPGRTWMVSDGEDLSTAELIRRLGAAMGRRVRLVPVPLAGLRLIGRLTGRSAEIDRLCGSLTVNIGPTRAALGWSPPVTADQALARTVEWYLSEGRLRDS